MLQPRSLQAHSCPPGQVLCPTAPQSWPQKALRSRVHSWTVAANHIQRGAPSLYLGVGFGSAQRPHSGPFMEGRSLGGPVQHAPELGDLNV